MFVYSRTDIKTCRASDTLKNRTNCWLNIGLEFTKKLSFKIRNQFETCKIHLNNSWFLPPAVQNKLLIHITRKSAPQYFYSPVQILKHPKATPQSPKQHNFRLLKIIWWRCDNSCLKRLMIWVDDEQRLFLSDSLTLSFNIKAIRSCVPGQDSSLAIRDSGFICQHNNSQFLQRLAQSCFIPVYTSDPVCSGQQTREERFVAFQSGDGNCV